MADEDEPRQHPGLTRETESRLRALARSARSGTAAAEPLDHLGTIRAQDYRQDIILKKTYAKWLLRIMTAQVAIADVGFFIYGFSVDWDLAGGVMHSWLAATVVEVIAIVLVVTKYLFHRPGDRP